MVRGNRGVKDGSFLRHSIFNQDLHLQPTGTELEKIVARSLRQAPPAQAPLIGLASWCAVRESLSGRRP